MEYKKYSTEVAGKPLTVEIGKLAQQANGSCYVTYGETSVLISATISEPKGADYFPLSVSYEERYYAAGKIKGSKWVKRETRPSDEAVLAGRVIDRTLRPRFDSSIRNEIQVVATVLSFDGVNDPDIISIFGASMALMISDIPFDGPVAGVRVGRVDGKLIFNPSYEERKVSDFDIIIAGTQKKMNMLEAELNIISEEDTANAIIQGFDELQPMIKFQNEIASQVNSVKQKLKIAVKDEEFVAKIRNFIGPKLNVRMYPSVNGQILDVRQAYEKGIKDTKAELDAYVNEQYIGSDEIGDKLKQSKNIFEEIVDQIVHENIVKSDKRIDGRALDELRDISAEVGVLPHVHGSGLFNRGNTQALSILTLAAPGLEQWTETMELDLTKKRFMHHYVFPPWSVGETGRIGFPGRREIGHGVLAEKALFPIIPSKEEFPYTIRLVTEILSSNGSSSQASVCGSVLALMDGGVPIKTPAAGIAMGLMMDQEGNNHKVLTDIQGPEDHHGDMDLKVAGTKDGITALQMDVKVEGIDADILKVTLMQARKARLEILEVLTKTIEKPRSELSKYAPRVKIMIINPEKIGMVIGPQGKVINKIIEETEVSIDIEDTGHVFITSNNEIGMQQAIKMIEQITYETKVGDEFEGRVVKLMDFGAFVEYMPGKDGMVHVSEISKEHVKKPSDLLKIDQVVHVRVKKIDDYGRINLTMLTDKQDRISK